MNELHEQLKEAKAATDEARQKGEEEVSLRHEAEEKHAQQVSGIEQTHTHAHTHAHTHTWASNNRQIIAN